MTTLATRLITLGTVVVLISGLIAITAPPAQADQPGCGLGTYNGITDECEISGTSSATGAFSFHHSVRMLAGATLNASGAGITLNINGAAGLDFSMDAGAVIEANDDIDPPNASAAAITINATDDITMAEGSRITADNLNAGGNGGPIWIDADGDMTMAGAGTLVGAAISSRHFGGAGDTGSGNNISITVGVAAAATGVLTLGGGATAYGAETGARIDATGNGPSGDIAINVGRDYIASPGSVVASGGYDGTAIQHGGKIYIVAGCQLIAQGRITSKGTDPGADLVHLEGCDVLIQGLVESTGKGHAQNTANSCDNVNDGLVGEVFRSDKPANATACIEVWGGNITIDSVNGWGELNADIGNGGTAGMSWIDIYATTTLNIWDGAGNNRESNNLGHTYTSTYAVHANQVNGSDTTPGVVTAKVTGGTLTANTVGGNVFQASTTGAGSNGGSITAEAAGNVNLDNAWLNAPGDFNATGGVGLGGQISVSSAGGALTWQNGNGDVRPETGTIAVNGCTSVNTTGTNFNGEVPVPTGGCGAVLIPGYVVFNTAIWALCQFEPPSETGSVVVHKTDADTDALVGGATFTIMPNVDVIALGLVEAMTLTEVADGIHCIDGLALGSYLVTENEEPPGYLPADPDTQMITVDGPSTCADALTREPDLIFENTVIEGDGSITIVKEVDCEECEALTRGYYFNRGGSHLEETNGLLGHTDDFGTGGIDADGETFSTVAEVQAYLDADQDGSSDGENGLSARGQLTVQYLAAVLNVRRNGEDCNLQARIYNAEESPFDGWTVREILDEAQDAFADESEYTDQEIKDALDAINNSTHAEENPLTCGEGTSGALLDGVTFHLFTAEDFEAEPQGDPLVGVTGDDGTGTLIFDNLALGDYVLVESGEPEGLDCEIQSVEASDGADATLEDDGTISITLSDENQGSANITLTVVNDCEQDEEEAIGSLLIAKVDADDVEVLLGGATFTVNGTAHEDADDDGFVCIDGLVLGETASVQETVAPSGYAGEPGVRDFLVLNEATCAERVGEETTPDDADAVFTNEAIDVPESEEFTLTKVNQAGALIGGVAFNLARTGEYDQTKSTNASGSVTFTGLLASKAYTLNETEPTNCTSKDPWTVTVAANGTITITDEHGTNVPAASGVFSLVNTCTSQGTLGGNPPASSTPAGQIPNTAFETGGPLPPFAPMLAALLLLSILGFVAARNLEAIRDRR